MGNVAVSSTGTFLCYRLLELVNVVALNAVATSAVAVGSVRDYSTGDRW